MTTSTSTTTTRPSTTTSSTEQSTTYELVNDDDGPGAARQPAAGLHRRGRKPRAPGPPNQKFVDVSTVGVSDPDGDPVTITISVITQDEPVERGDGGYPCPDAAGVGGRIARIRAERRGSGDGRVYHVAFVANDGRGGQCDGTVTVCVPISQKPSLACVDQGALFDSLTGACTSPCDDLCAVEMAVGSICSAEHLPQALSGNSAARGACSLARRRRATTEARTVGWRG